MWADLRLQAEGQRRVTSVFFFFFQQREATQLSLPLPRQRRQIVGGSCLSLARILWCWATQITSEVQGSSVTFGESVWFCPQRRPMEGLKFHVLISHKRGLFTAHFTMPTAVSREELRMKWSSGCRWFLFMPSYPNKGREPEARSAREHTQWDWCMGMFRALPD